MKLTPESKLSYDSQSLLLDGKRFFPVMGEIHYSRVRPETWLEELLKMKAGGVDIVSTYTIWIHHEEVAGEWDFSGIRDLRRFLLCVQESGLHLILRIGPWVHAEVRNGGFPDWLMEKERQGLLRLRTNDEGYLAEVRRFYERIYQEVQGLFLKDGGPIIGVQIENEFGHCGGLQGEEGERHMRTLHDMAVEIGYDVPIYTATGWGGAVTGGMLPVMGGYCEAPWDQRLTEIEPSGNYVFTEERNDHAIGSDFGLGEGLTFDMTKFPYLTAELGGGLQVTSHRRPVATGRDTEAMSIAKLGSGCNLLGYYMYHGGTNPEGKLTTLQESRQVGDANELPILSYDFNAPIKEFGQLTDSYRRIRRLAMAVHDYGETLCSCKYIPQPGNPEKPENLTDLRSAVRMNEKGEGFYFVNNYQRHHIMAAHLDQPLVARDQDGNVVADFGCEDVKDGDVFFYPFNLELKGPKEGQTYRLEKLNAVPLCVLHDVEDNIYVFFRREGITAPVDGEDWPLPVTLAEGIKLLVLSEEDALYMHKVELGGVECLIYCDDDLVPDEKGKVKALAAGIEAPVFYSILDVANDMWLSVIGEEEIVDILQVAVTEEEIREDGSKELLLHMDATRFQQGPADAKLEGLRLKFHYEGYSAEVFAKVNGEWKLYDDSFYTGQSFEVDVASLYGEWPIDKNALPVNRKADLMASGDPFELELKLVIHPLTEEHKLYLEHWPELPACRLDPNIETETIWITKLPNIKD